MPIDPGSILVTVTDRVAQFTFGHPKSNSLPGALLRNMASVFDQLGSNRDVSVIILQSAGHAAFCAGASFEELRAIRDEAQGKEFFSGFAHLLLAMRRCPKFIVTRVQGKAAGGGVGIIAASDYVIAVPAAAVRLSELAIGIGPFVVGPVIERRVGVGPFTAMSIDAEWRDAGWAERHGLYAKIVDSHLALDSVCPAFTARLAAANPQAIAELKKTFWAGTEHWDTLLFERAALSGRLVLSEHSRRAIEAFGSA
jgi:methylglutaconyl-CoA hydratase